MVGRYDTTATQARNATADLVPSAAALRLHPPPRGRGSPDPFAQSSRDDAWNG